MCNRISTGDSSFTLRRERLVEECLVPATCRWKRYLQGKEASLGPTSSHICVTGPDCSTQWHRGLDLGPLGGQTVLTPLAGITVASRLVFPLRPPKKHVSSSHFNSHTLHPKMPSVNFSYFSLSRDEHANLSPLSASHQALGHSLHYS